MSLHLRSDQLTAVLFGQGCRVHGSGVVYHDCAGLVIEKGIEERRKNVGRNVDDKNAELYKFLILVDEMGFEPTTSSLRTVGKIS